MSDSPLEPEPRRGVFGKVFSIRLRPEHADLLRAWVTYATALNDGQTVSYRTIVTSALRHLPLPAAGEDAKARDEAVAVRVAYRQIWKDRP